jgi:alpha-tubulin suppressor-like RCC1 family protein
LSGNGINAVLNAGASYSSDSGGAILVNKTFCQITGGYHHSLGIDKYGKVWGLGYNFNGQLGINSIVNKSTPTAILGVNKTFCQISCGYQHSLGIDKYGQVWGLGI